MSISRTRTYGCGECWRLSGVRLAALSMEGARGWREIHPSAVARRRVLQLPRLATLIVTILDAQSGTTCLISEQEQQDLGGDAVQVSSSR